MHCRINRQRLWANRMLLESYCHERNCFVTLTYSDENLPAGGNLVPKHFSDWLKRFRKDIFPITVRYYGVGEYGERTQRPHYHAALFGVDQMFEDRILKTWNMGHVHVGDITLHSTSYIASYITKSMTRGDDARLCGRHPEFARMSLKPGIGALAVADLAKAFTSKYGSLAVSRNGDIPDTIGTGRKQMPLGRYLKERLRNEVGLDEGWQEIPKARYLAEMQVMQDDYGKALFQVAKPYVDWAKIDSRESNARRFKKVKPL